MRLLPAVRAAAALCLLCLPVAARAVTATVEAASDERRRGLSWSDGRATAGARLSVDAGPALRLEGTATALRGSRRHGGADAGFDLAGSWRGGSGPFRLDGAVLAHLFAGGTGRLGYAEAQAGLGTTLGPVDLDLSATYAPSQRAIGGDNLYLAAGLRAAVIGTPFTLVGGVGRSSGGGRNGDRENAVRLRPDGSYVDWRLGIQHARGPLEASLLYVGNNIGRVPESRFAGTGRGDTLLVRLALTL